jgi:hypothetical protein
MALVTILREIPNKVANVLAKYMRELSDEEREEMKKEMMALTEEMFGEKTTKEKKSKPQVVTPAPAVITREYLETLTVSELKQLGKDSVKGRKPRAEIIEILLQSLSGSAVASAPVASPVASAPVASPVSSAESSGSRSDESGSEDELRAEPVPVIAVEEVPKKKRAPKAKEPKEPKEKKEKKAKAPAEEKEETEISVRSWYHPSEMSKPQEERKKYYIDPETNLLYHPDQPTDRPVGKWDEETSEIIPIS